MEDGVVQQRLQNDIHETRLPEVPKTPNALSRTGTLASVALYEELVC